MLRNRMILFFLANFLIATAAASEIDFNLSNDAFKLRYGTNVGNGAQAGFGFVHTKDRVNVVNLGLHLVDNAGSQTDPFQVGLGGKLVFVDTAGPSGGAIALGAFARYNFPTANRFALAGSLHYAPDVTSFSDVSKYLEYDIRAEYEVLRNGSIYLGYRRIDARFGTGSPTVKLDKGLHFGMRFTF